MLYNSELNPFSAAMKVTVLSQIMAGLVYVLSPIWWLGVESIIQKIKHQVLSVVIVSLECDLLSDNP